MLCGGWNVFFTVNLHNRGTSLLVEHIEELREVVRFVKSARPFVIDAWVVLPDHLHAVWTLPRGDANYSIRWQEIKKRFSKALPKTESLSSSNLKRGERGIWQKRFWEHCIRDEQDYQRHIDYVHINPFKHGLVTQVKDWPYSSFHRAVELGQYPQNWCGV
jgi:Transposase and inactivated derivatives